MYTATRRFQFCCGHRVYMHESKCKHPHGHNYVLYADFVAKEDYNDLDELGRVIDFSVIKAILGNYIEAVFDHGFLFYELDTEMKNFYELNPDFKHLCMKSNPTAENIAKYILDACESLFKRTNVKCTHIKLYETENCYVEVW